MISKEYLEWIKYIFKHTKFEFYSKSHSYDRKAKSHNTFIGNGTRISEEEYLAKKDDGNRLRSKAFFGSLKIGYIDYHVKAIYDEEISEIEKNALSQLYSDTIYNLGKESDTNIK